MERGSRRNSSHRPSERQIAFRHFDDVNAGEQILDEGLRDHDTSRRRPGSAIFMNPVARRISPATDLGHVGFAGQLGFEHGHQLAHVGKKLAPVALMAIDGGGDLVCAQAGGLAGDSTSISKRSAFARSKRWAASYWATESRRCLSILSTTVMTAASSSSMRHRPLPFA